MTIRETSRNCHPNGRASHSTSHASYTALTENMSVSNVRDNNH